MSKGRIEQSYFDEKKELAMTATTYVKGELERALELLNTLAYRSAGDLDAFQVHDCIKSAASHLVNIRVNFEKARWAAADTELEFEQWLIKHNNADLI